MGLRGSAHPPPTHLDHFGQMSFVLSTQLFCWQWNNPFQKARCLLCGLHQEPASGKQQEPELVLHLLCSYPLYNNDPPKLLTLRPKSNTANKKRHRFGHPLKQSNYHSMSLPLPMDNHQDTARSPEFYGVITITILL